MDADPQSPDHSTCRFCREPITWDEVCYVHDYTGFADCGLVITGGQPLGRLVLDPVLIKGPGTYAEPVEWV